MIDRLKLEYLTPRTASRYDFYSFPKLLIHHEAFDGLDYGAKILYSLILSRASLSATNAKDFTDKNGRLYIIYTIEQVMKDLRYSNKTAIKIVKQLEEIGLIEKTGPGKTYFNFCKRLLIKSLFDLPVTKDTYYTNLVHADMYNKE